MSAVDTSEGIGVVDRGSSSTHLREAAIAGVVVLLGTLLLGSSDRLLVGSFNDDGVYIALGRAIAEGEGYRSIHAPGDPVHAKYPPGLPAVLAVLWWIGGSLPTVVVLAHVANLAAVAASAALCWWYGRAVLGLTPVPLALMGIGPFFLDATLQYNSLILSEPYFLLGWLAALILYSRLSPGADGSSRIRTAASLGFVLAATTLFRVQGVVLIAALLVLLAIRRQGWRVWLACAVTSLAPVLAWSAMNRLWRARGPVSGLPDEFSYVDWIRAQRGASAFVDVLAVVASNVGGYLRIFSHYISGTRPIGIAVVCVFLAIAAVGLWGSRRRHAALCVTSLATLGVILIWPFVQDRLMLSELPFLGLLVAVAVDRRLHALPGRGRRMALVALVAVAGVVAFRQASIRIDALRSVDADLPADGFSPSYVLTLNSRYIEVASGWLIANARPADRVLAELPAGIYLRTGLKTAGSMVAHAGTASNAFDSPGEYLARRIVEDRVTLVSLGNLGLPIARDVAVVMERCPGVLTYAGGYPGRPVPAFFRVSGGDDCLRERILGDGTDAPRSDPASNRP